MRVILFFDLPMQTEKERNEYTHFRKFLIKSGFMMLQKSVYAKLALNSTVMNAIKESVRQNLPPKGIIQMLEVTEKQFSQTEYLLGEKQSKVVDSDQRLVIL